MGETTNQIVKLFNFYSEASRLLYAKNQDFVGAGFTINDALSLHKPAIYFKAPLFKGGWGDQNQ
jgi:hypothetical protein